MNTINFPYVDANYRKEPVTRYSGNPYIEAIPDIPDDQTLARALAYFPKFEPSLRALPAPVRIQLLDELQQLVVPLPRLVRLARAVLKVMRTGYGKRKPFSRSDNDILRRIYEQQQSGSFQSMHQTSLAVQVSMALIGAAGCGKSYALRQISGLLPPAIYHADYGKWQLPFLFIEMSYDGESVHTLASALFSELDRLLPDAGYTELYMQRGRLNAQQRLFKALALAYEHAVGMIFVDESQNQKAVGKRRSRRDRQEASSNAPKNETPLAKLLITASNTSHVPLLLAGTLEMQYLVGSRFTRARRMAGRGSAVWFPLARSGCLSKPDEFEIFLKAIWPYQWIQRPVALTQQLADLIYSLTQGIPDIIIKLFESAQEAAIANGSETLTPELLENVFAKEFVPAAFGIKALETGDRVLLEAVSDLYQPDPVEEAFVAGLQFPAPAPKPVRHQKPLSPRSSAASKATHTSKRLPKNLRPGPTPRSISLQVAAASDLRSTSAGGPDGPSMNVVNMDKHFPS